MEIKNTKIYNFEGAFRGMRNPLNSWHRSDSWFGIGDIYNEDYLTDVCDAWIDNENKIRAGLGLPPLKEENEETVEFWDDCYSKYFDWLIQEGTINSYDEGVGEFAFIGPNDLKLAQKLILAGPEHAKFLRQIEVCTDITAPLYWWKEFDTYKIGTTANSTSTMHKLASTKITRECFEIDPEEDRLQLIDPIHLCVRVDCFINDLEQLRQMYEMTGDKKYWTALVRWLPQGWLQTRTVTMNYSVLRNMYFQRHNHKLKEWHIFCDWIKELPYGYELITREE